MARATLRIAAEYADYTNFFGNLAEFSRKNEVLRGHCATIGRDETQITRSANVNVVIGDTEVEVSERLEDYYSRRVAMGLPEDVVRREIEGLRGSAISTELQRRLEPEVYAAPGGAGGAGGAGGLAGTRLLWYA